MIQRAGLHRNWGAVSGASQGCHMASMQCVQSGLWHDNSDPPLQQDRLRNHQFYPPEKLSTADQYMQRASWLASQQFLTAVVQDHMLYFWTPLSVLLCALTCAAVLCQSCTQVVCCNLKPAKMRDIMSYGMVSRHFGQIVGTIVCLCGSHPGLCCRMTYDALDRTPPKHGVFSAIMAYPTERCHQ